MRRKHLITILIIIGLAILWVPLVAAEEPVKVAILTDMSGPYAGICASNVEAVKMAIEDFGGMLLGKKIEFFYRDHHCKPDIANQRAKELYEREKVDIIIDVPNSAAGLAVSEQARLHKRLFISVGSGTTEHSGAKCHRYCFDWAYNDYMLATSVGLWGADNLGKRWYTITADYAWGHDLFKHFTAALKKKGGILLGNDNVALGTADFTPYLLKAKRAKPDVLVLLNAGKDANNATKQAVEFGLKKEMKIIHALIFVPSIRAVGPEIFADDYVAGAWYWKVDTPGAREFADRWLKKFGHRPNWMNPANYSATLQYLEAVKRAGTKDPKAVIKQLEGHTFRDLFASPGYIRAEDHMQVGKAYIFRAKRPEEIKEKDDCFEIVGTIPPEQAYMDPNKTGCKMGGF